jgi:hypothetical protein
MLAAVMVGLLMPMIPQLRCDRAVQLSTRVIVNKLVETPIRL